MPDPDMLQGLSDIRLGALSRWDNEGGSIATAAQDAYSDVLDMTNAELVLLRVRVIALENLLISVLAEGSDQQRQAAREMADMISPRIGFTQHSLTIRAAQHMTDLVDRANHFRTLPAAVTNGPAPYKSTPVFDADSLPAGLRREHRTKVGVWGVIRVLEGRLRYRVINPASETILDPDHPGLVLPDQPHLVEPLGTMRMQVDFYDCPPEEQSS